MSASGKNYVVDDFTIAHTTAQHVVGSVIEAEGKEYRYIQNSTTDTATAGCPCVLVAAGGYVVTVKFTNATVVATNAFMGVFMTALATSEYGYILKSGEYNTCTVTDSITFGNAGVLGDANGGFGAAGSAGLLRICCVAHENSTGADTGVTLWIDAP